MRLQGQRQEGAVEFEATCPAHGEALVLPEQGGGLLHDGAEYAQPLAGPLREITGMTRRRLSSRRTAFE
ncbi:hypothetical protein [Streptomyces sp. SAS_270]|uniref:hypothetical protein n=1 Tax=Streptomyces sp. SAS_270 TaxID=3412748 RepID=UPI00403C425D